MFKLKNDYYLKVNPKKPIQKLLKIKFSFHQSIHKNIILSFKDNNTLSYLVFQIIIIYLNLNLGL